MKDMRPFFVMPGQAIIDLREELELIEGEEAGETLQRYGFRAGIGLIKSLGISASDFMKYSTGASQKEIGMYSQHSRIEPIGVIISL